MYSNSQNDFKREVEHKVFSEYILEKFYEYKNSTQEVHRKTHSLIVRCLNM